MKRLMTLMFCLLSMQIAQAQYWYLASPSIGLNPRNLNHDIEEPLVAVNGWTSILATISNPAWSLPQNLPFPFQFNGIPVTQFKVSNSGVLTFDVGTTLGAPSFAKSALPNASIPNNSICIWGIRGTGANDRVVTKLFGSTPNRQFWIQFSSYSYDTSTSIFTYWAVVLEETSNTIHIVDQRTGGAGTPVVALAAGLQFSGSSAMSIPGSPTLNTTTSPGGSNNNTYLDNTYYTFTPGVQPTNEGAVISMDPKMLTKNSFALTGGTIPVTVRIQNQGSAAMSGYNIKINDGANTTNYPQTGSLASGSLSNVNINYTMATAGYKPISLWIEYTGDTNPLNDSAKSEFNGATYSPTKQVVFEEATGTWCQWCPRGAVYMDSIAKVHPEVVAIAVHNADPMVVANYDTPMGALIGGYPSGLVDRKLEADPSDFFTEYNNHKNDFAIADLTVTPSVNGNTISVKVDAKMAIDSRPNYDYRLGLVITQEDMTGTTAQWSQSNAYAGGGNGPMGGYESKPNPVPFSQMVYDHVARAILTDFNGASGSLPANMTAGQTYSHTFNWTVPANTPIMNLKANALLICGLNGEIHNGKWATIYPVSVNDIVDETKLVIFPNPSNDIVHVDLTLKKLSDFTVSISDMVGRVVYEKAFSALSGNQGLSIPTSNFNSGNYILNIQTSAGSIQRKITVNH